MWQIIWPKSTAEVAAAAAALIPVNDDTFFHYLDLNPPHACRPGWLPQIPWPLLLRDTANIFSNRYPLLLTKTHAPQAAAASKSWQIIAANIGTISTGIDFVNATTGFIGLDINGVGAEVARSSDGGKTWPFVGQSPFGLLFLDVAAFGPNVVVAGVLELLYSNDHGATFQSANATPGAGQCIRNIGPNGAEIGFASVGDWGIFTDVNGIVVSYDGGATFATISDNMTAGECA